MYVTEEEMDKINKILYTVFIYLFLTNRAGKIATGLPNNGKPKGTSPTPCEKHNGFFNVAWTGITRSMV